MPNFLLANQNSDQLRQQNYDKDKCTAGVLHLGVGAFHRAHQAVYFDQLLARDEGQHWGIIGVNLRPQDSQVFQQLMAQKGEFVLKTMSAQGETQYQHIRSLLQLVDGALEPNNVDALMADEQIQLITTTVTEGGYYLDEHRQLMLDHPAIKEDLQGARNTLYAFLYEGLKQRSETSNAKITLLCCDNLRHNGALLKAGLLAFIEAKNDLNLLSWVLDKVSFPSSMVDRITPKPSLSHIHEVQTRFDIHDCMTVMAEDFIQWVIEDDFAGKKPPLDQVGVQFTQAVTPYEEAKIRILNAGHTCLAYQAALKGIRYFDQAMADPQLQIFFQDFIQQEAIPALGHSVVDLKAYAKIVGSRFSNANIGDTVERICTDGYAKFPIFVYPSLKGIYQQGGQPKLCIQAIAAWFVFIQLTRQGLLDIQYHEPNLHQLSPFSHDEQGIHAFATDTYLWQDLPRLHPEFIPALKHAIEQTYIQFEASRKKS